MAWTKQDQIAFNKAYEAYLEAQETNRAIHEQMKEGVLEWYDNAMKPYWDDESYVDPQGASAVVGGAPSRNFQIRQLKIRKKIRLGDANEPLLENSRMWDELMQYGSDLANDVVNPHVLSFYDTADPKKEVKKPSVVHEFEVTKWKETASGRWRRALHGTWPDWVDRIVLRFMPEGKGAEMRIFNANTNGMGLSLTMNGLRLVMRWEQFSRGYGYTIDLTENQLRSVMGDCYHKIKKGQR